MVHARNALRARRGRLVAVASTRPERAAEAARGARTCALQLRGAVRSARRRRGGPRRALDRPRDSACAVLEAGKHLFLEKPGATTLAGHDAVRAAARRGRDGRAGRLPPPVRRALVGGESARRGRARSDGRSLVLGVARDVRTPEPEDPRRDRRLPRRHGRRTTTTPRAGSSAQEPVEVNAARQARVYPGARGARRSRQRRCHGALRRRRHRRRCTSRARARGATTCGPRSSATRARCSSASSAPGRVVTRADGRVPAGLPRAVRATPYAAELGGLRGRVPGRRAGRRRASRRPARGRGRRRRARKRRRRAAARGRRRLALAPTAVY